MSDPAERLCGATAFTSPHVFDPDNPNDAFVPDGGDPEWETCDQHADHPIHQVEATALSAELSRLFDDLLMARAASELDVQSPAGLLPTTPEAVAGLVRYLEDVTRDLPGCGNLDAASGTQCERAAGHTGSCAALTIFTAPTRLCDTHTAQARQHPGFQYARPLSTN